MNAAEKLKIKWRLRIEANLESILHEINNNDLMKTKYINFDRFIAIMDRNEIHFNEQDFNAIVQIC